MLTCAADLCGVRWSPGVSGGGPCAAHAERATDVHRHYPAGGQVLLDTTQQEPYALQPYTLLHISSSRSCSSGHAILTCLSFWLCAQWLASNTTAALGKHTERCTAAEFMCSTLQRFCELWPLFCRSHSLAGATGSFVHRSPAVSVDHRHPCAAPLFHTSPVCRTSSLKAHVPLRRPV